MPNIGMLCCGGAQCSLILASHPNQTMFYFFVCLYCACICVVFVFVFVFLFVL